MREWLNGRASASQAENRGFDSRFPLQMEVNIMAYRVTKRTSYGSRILNSFVGVLVGIALIIGMSILLFVNEGRFNLAELASEAQEITAPNATLDNELIWYKGNLTGEDLMVYDAVIKNANYIRLTSSVDVYAWIETSRTETRDNFGGSQEQVTIYEYHLGWTSNPQAPSTFEDPDFRDKPAILSTELEAFKVDKFNTTVKAGEFSVDTSILSIDEVSNLPLTAATLNEDVLNDDIINTGTHIYYKSIGSNGPATPEFGDIRVQYSYTPAIIEGVLVGKAQGDSIVRFTNEDGSVYRFFMASSLEEVVSILDSEHKTTTWLLRLIGTLLMCIGFSLLTGPFSTLLMVVPMLGKASKFLLGIVSFLIGFVYSVLIIVLSAIIHNPIALVIAIAIVILAVVMGYKKSKQKTATKKAK